MAERSGFFDAHVMNGKYDRVYLSEHFAKYFASFIGNGVFGGKSSELMVSPNVNLGMKVDVLSGMSWINGFWYENTSNLTLDVSIADGVLNRIDNVVVRWGKIERSIWITIVKGTPAANAVAPSIERSSEYYDLKLAEISVKAGTTNITQADITDTRLNSDVCGFVVGVVQQFDTTEFGNQLNGYISKYAAEYKSFLEGLELTGTNELNSLIDRLNALVSDESAFANLVLSVDNIANETALNNQTLGYSKKNLIPYPYEETTKTITGITWTDNKDGTIHANGTALEDTYFMLYKGKMLQTGKYFITSGIDDSAQSYYVYISFTDKTDETITRKTYRSFENTSFEVTESDAQNCNILIGIVVGKGKTISNITFKPMLRRAEILSGTWEPYRLSVEDRLSAVEMIQEDKTEKGCFYRMNHATGIKEWINPPLRYGVEYCTTERWENKPVYQKALYLSTLPNKSVTSLSTGTQWDRVISIDAYALNSGNLTHYPFPIIPSGRITPIATISSVESNGTLVITTTEDVSNFKAYVTIKYVKA